MKPIKYENEARAPIVFSDEGAVWHGELKFKPEIEQELFLKQEKFYKEKNENKRQLIWRDMFTLVQKYSKSLILKKIKGRRYVEPDEVDDQATQTALSFMSQYIYRPGYHVGASFAGMINPKVLETLYKHSKEDSHYSLNSILGDTNLELEDMQERIGFESIYGNNFENPGDFINRISLKDTLNGIIKEFCKEVKNETFRFKLMLYIQILLRKPKNKHTRPMFFKYITPNKKEYDLIHLFEYELQKRLSNN